MSEKAGIKIRIVKNPITGEDCVPPEVMSLLLRFAEHRDLCSQCKAAYDQKNVKGYCETGHALLFELGQQPEVFPL